MSEERRNAGTQERRNAGTQERRNTGADAERVVEMPCRRAETEYSEICIALMLAADRGDREVITAVRKALGLRTAPAQIVPIRDNKKP